ncbi:methyl-accepting chemotaxis protein [Treponema sp. R80B11-R83G3]
METKLKNIKIKLITKLTVSAFVFLLPLGIMLHSVISASFSSIKKDRIELKGIEVLRPVFELMQNIPFYIRIYIDNSPGDIDYTKQHITELLFEIKDKYEEYFSNEAYVVSPQTLIENWENMSKTVIRDSVLWAYRQIMQDLNRIIVYIGDISGLVTDSDIESAYLIAASINELPQAQDRVVLIGNLLRTIESGAFTQRRRTELQLNLELLQYSDNSRIQNRFNTAGTMRKKNTDTLESFEILLKACYDNIAYYASTVGSIINEPELNTQVIPALYDVASRVNNATFRLQTASLDRLEALILKRISTYRLRLILSLTAAIFATLFAFVIIFITNFGIRKATDNMSVVFKRLNENDLTVKIESLSNDELGDFMKALSVFLSKLQNTFSSFNKNTSMVSTSVYELSSTTKEMTAVANEQSASVSEIVTTMENNRNISAQSAEKTSEVAHLASQTQELSRRGAELREINENMMLDVRNQNAKIIEIIRNLAEMLSRIDESVKLIDTIADHTKLIAFNAALEASSSGEAGSRFSVVASEIRRFADNVVESASEIKEKISELQEASQSLLTEANNGSRKIDIGYNRIVEQKEVFENIVDASKNVAIRTQQISSLTKQQEYAATQVFSALKEISAGVNQFVHATVITSETVNKLNNMSKELKETLAKYHITGGNN